MINAHLKVITHGILKAVFANVFPRTWDSPYVSNSCRDVKKSPRMATSTVTIYRTKTQTNKPKLTLEEFTIFYCSEFKNKL